MRSFEAAVMNCLNIEVGDDGCVDAAVAGTLKVLMNKEKLVGLNYMLLKEVEAQRNAVKEVRVKYAELEHVVVKVMLANEGIEQAIVESQRLKGGFSHECWF